MYGWVLLCFMYLYWCKVSCFCNRRHQDVTSQLSSQSTNENAAYQNTTQGQTKYGYNFHHIDQRTENQSASRACADTKSENQHTTEVYAELTTDALVQHFRSEQSENQFEAGLNAHHSLDDARVNCQHAAESLYKDESACASELQYSQHRADEQSHYDSEYVHYQYKGEPIHQSDAHPKTEDHAQYVPEEYVYFLQTRWAFSSKFCTAIIPLINTYMLIDFLII